MKREDNHVIHQFIKRTVNGLPNQRVGVIVAKLGSDGKIKYGWSLAKVKATRRDLEENAVNNREIKTDKYDEFRGLNIAFGRLNAREVMSGVLKMPSTVRSQLRDRLVQVKEFVEDRATGKVKTVRRVKVVRGFESRAKKYFKV